MSSIRPPGSPPSPGASKRPAADDSSGDELSFALDTARHGDRYVRRCVGSPGHPGLRITTRCDSSFLFIPASDAQRRNTRPAQPVALRDMHPQPPLESPEPTLPAEAMPALEGLLKRHAEFGLTYGEMAARVLRHPHLRTWGAVDFMRLDNMARLALTAAATPMMARTFLSAVLELEPAQVASMSRVIDMLCEARTSADRSLLLRDLFRSVQNIGYQAIESCSEMFIDGTSPQERAQIVRAISGFTDARLAAAATDMAREGLTHYLLSPSQRALIIDIFEAAKQEAFEEVTQLTDNPKLRMACLIALEHAAPPDVRRCLADVRRLAGATGLSKTVMCELLLHLIRVNQNGAARTAEGLHAVLEPQLALQLEPREAAKQLLRIALETHPYVNRLHHFVSQNVPPVFEPTVTVGRSMGEYLLNFVEVREGLTRLNHVMKPLAGWNKRSAGGRDINTLLGAAVRAGEALPRFFERIQTFGVHEDVAWAVMRVLVRAPIDGTAARMILAGFATDDALTLLTHLPQSELPAVFEAVVLDVQRRLGDGENVHQSLRIRAADAAVDMLRSQQDGAPVDEAARMRDIEAYITQLDAQSVAGSMWQRKRTTRGRTTVGNARYVLTGPFYEERDLSRSVAETPEYRELCALVWRAIDIYRHPSGDDAATAHEQREMREDMILGLAECVRDEDGYRVCPVGFKQRVVGILQGDERYPEIVVDATNAAQLLTMAAREFWHQNDGDTPPRAKIEEFRDHMRDTAGQRFHLEPQELQKFHEQLDTWLKMDYDYETDGSRTA